MKSRFRHFLLVALATVATTARADEPPTALTPKPPPTPRINGPSIFGIRPGSPFLYHIPATGQRPMQFSVSGLPEGLCDEIHNLVLKAGIYSTPWTTSYASHIGGSAENPEGDWSPPTAGKRSRVNNKSLPWAIGKYSFATNDARQWAAWGIDYLKYDWNPNEVPETREMADALRGSGRDVVFSLSNSSPFKNMPGLSKYANSWRTTGDIRDTWASMSAKGFSQDKWVRFSGPGHWNDPDMLVVGRVGWGSPHLTRLTPDEQ
jgi:alpha-galactosidase